jgi:polar amino acid transport system substrate-binding protein
MSTRARRCAAGALIAWVALAIAPYGSPRDEAQRRSLAALTLADPASVAPHTPPTGDDFSPAEPSCPPFESRPASALPPPLHMKPGTLMHNIQKRGELIAGVDHNTLGLGYFNPIGTRNEGFEIDLVRQIARAILGPNPKIRFTAISTAQRESVVTKKQVDLVASSFSITCKRRETMLFSDVYYRAQMRLLVPKRPRVDDLGALRDKLVCVTRRSTTLSRLDELAGRTAIKIYVVPLRSDCLVALQEGKVQAISSDDAILYGLLTQDPQTRIVGPGLQCERWGMAINNDYPEFVSFVNGVLVRLRHSGFIDRRRARWLKGLERPRRAAPCPP